MRAHTLFGSALILVACRTDGTKTPAPAKAPIPQAVATEVVASMDRAADPCTDFYRYACGGWLDATPLPSDETRYGRFHVLRDRNNETLREILDTTAAVATPTPEQKQLGQFWRACNDEAAIEAAGLAGIAPLLAEIDGVRDPAGLLAAVGSLQRRGVEVLFDLEVEPDYKRPEINIAYLGQGGLGLPDREFYLGDDPHFAELRDGYRAHVARMLELAGMPVDAARQRAADVLAFETQLAKAGLPREKLRDPEERYHKVDRAGLAQTSALPWETWFAAVGRPDLAELSLTPPSYFAALPGIVAGVKPEVLRAYLQFHTLHAAADHLPSAFVQENFAFYGQALRGQKQLAPRWKRCVEITDRSLGELVGRDFVAKRFGGNSRDVALSMIRAIETSFAAGLPSLAWMDVATRTQALGKMHAIVNKIGYPEKWRDYGALAIGDDHLANVAAAAAFDFDRRAREIGRAVDESEWFMTPPTVNAYYNASGNEMVFPAGILQPPFFASDWPMAMNFGGIGMVMGHELTHGFDDQGRKFDGEGTLREWWAPAVADRFEDRAECVDALYSSYEVQPGVKLSGKLTLGENIADLGGIKQSHRAFQQWAAANGLDPRAEALDGLTHEQLFFVAFGQIWCTNATPETERVLALTDSHSHPRYRVNGPLSNFPEFGEAFSCEPGERMRPANVCEVW
ncbi:MAG TPA: M13 family metallopeptidase [Nannocystaceae bacterium]|nr:M13 family metallopeptidase [Nannocystaceae bacterium]